MKVTDVGAALDPQFERVNDTPRTDAVSVSSYFIGIERELAEAKKDADRYRWLRDNSYNVQIGVYELVNRDGRQQRAWLASNELDEVIDAAMQEGGK
jgi:hypothetical protein